MLNRWFSKAQKYYGDFAFLQADMHSHLLFGIDDGSRNIEETIFFIEALKKLGYSTFIMTPHILSDLYPNSKGTIQPVFNQVKSNFPETNLQYAAEYMIDSDFDMAVETADLLTFHNNYVLVEMSYLGESKNFRDIIFKLRVKGFQPVLAHPERYGYWHRNYKKYEEAKDLGCMLQLNILSVIGYYGPAVRDTAFKLLSDHFYDFAGTDLHHEKHLNAMKDMCTSKILHQLSLYNFKNAELAVKL
jgi:protein-tyrosine phosphatase